MKTCYNRAQRPVRYFLSLCAALVLVASAAMSVIAQDMQYTAILAGNLVDTEAGTATVTERERTPGLPVVKMLKLTCDFEANLTWVAAVASPNAYRVTELNEPTRLVVDVQH